MKDTADKLTADLIEPAKKRGRPATGKALTAAERKRRQRERDRHSFTAIEGESGYREPHEMSMSALIENLSYAVSKGWAVDARELADELVKRARAKQEEKAASRRPSDAPA